jgi:hypothetical protein
MNNCSPRSFAKYLRNQKLKVEVNGHTVRFDYWCIHFYEDDEVIRIWHSSAFKFNRVLQYSTPETIYIKLIEFSKLLPKVFPYHFYPSIN